MELTLEQLKEVAIKVGYKHHHNVGVEKLAKELEEYCISVGTSIVEVYTPTSPPIESEQETDTNINTHTNTSADANTEFDKDLILKLSNISFSSAEQSASKSTSNERQREAMKLIRCIISCNNKNKNEYTGEIFCARNKVLPEVKKFVPFGVITHIPQILLSMIQEKQYQMFRSKKINGNTIKETYLVPEYNIQILPPISTEEFEAIARKQLAEGSNRD